MFFRGKNKKRAPAEVAVNPAFAALRAAGASPPTHPASPGATTPPAAPSPPSQPRPTSGSPGTSPGPSPPRVPSSPSPKPRVDVANPLHSRRHRLNRGNSIPDFIPRARTLPPPPGAGTKDIVSQPPPARDVLKCITMRAGVPSGAMTGELGHSLHIGAAFSGYLQRLEKVVRMALGVWCLGVIAPACAHMVYVLCDSRSPNNGSGAAVGLCCLGALSRFGKMIPRRNCWTACDLEVAELGTASLRLLSTGFVLFCSWCCWLLGVLDRGGVDHVSRCCVVCMGVQLVTKALGRRMCFVFVNVPRAVMENDSDVPQDPCSPTSAPPQTRLLYFQAADVFDLQEWMQVCGLSGWWMVLHLLVLLIPQFTTHSSQPLLVSIRFFLPKLASPETLP